MAPILGRTSKPLLKLTQRIQELEELVGEYRSVEYEARKIEVAIRQRKRFDVELQDRFAKLMDQMGSLATRKGGEFNVRRGLVRKCRLEVADELPARNFFVPEEITP